MVLKFNARLVKCQLKYGWCNRPLLKPGRLQPIKPTVSWFCEISPWIFFYFSVQMPDIEVVVRLWRPSVRTATCYWYWTVHNVTCHTSRRIETHREQEEDRQRQTWDENDAFILLASYKTTRSVNGSSACSRQLCLKGAQSSQGWHDIADTDTQTYGQTDRQTYGQLDVRCYWTLLVSYLLRVAN